MLAIIENDKRDFALQIFLQKLKGCFSQLLTYPNRGQDGLRDQVWIGQWREFHEPDTVLECFKRICCDLQRKTRFAGAAGACEGDQTVILQNFPDFSNLLLTPDERGEL